MTAWTSWFLHRWPLDWYWRDDVRPAYATVAWFWVVYWTLRSGVQAALFNEGRTELLAVVRVLSGLPIGIPLLIGSYIFGTWRLRTLGGPSIDEHTSGAEPPYQSQQRGF